MKIFHPQRKKITYFLTYKSRGCELTGLDKYITPQWEKVVLTDLKDKLVSRIESKEHKHDNKEILDNINISKDGKLTYNGNEISEDINLNGYYTKEESDANFVKSETVEDSSIDYDTLTQKGIYTVNGSNINTPGNSDGGSLIVLNTGLGDNDKTQIYIPKSSQNINIRTKTDTGWSGWSIAGANGSSDSPALPKTIIIAASDASDESKALAKYICAGNNDNETISAAVAELGEYGGRIFLTEGTFVIKAQNGHIIIGDDEHAYTDNTLNIIIEGLGEQTVLLKNYDGSGGDFFVLKPPLNSLILKNLKIEYPNSYNYGCNYSLFYLYKINLQGKFTIDNCVFKSDTIVGQNSSGKFFLFRRESTNNLTYPYQNTTIRNSFFDMPYLYMLFSYMRNINISNNYISIRSSQNKGRTQGLHFTNCEYMNIGSNILSVGNTSQNPGMSFSSCKNFIMSGNLFCYSDDGGGIKQSDIIMSNCARYNITYNQFDS